MNGVFDKKAKTVYIDTGEKHGKKNAVLGAFFLFLCVFAGCFGLVSCVIESFQFEVSKYWIALETVKYLLFFTVVYFLPLRLFTLIALLCGAAFPAFYIWTHLEELIKIGSAALNWCLFRINQAGYNIGALVDRPLAAETPHQDYLIVFTFALILLTGIFSYLIYSRKNVFFNVVVSVAVIFPGFFYGLIPGYFSFSLIAAFWVSNFAVNMFDSGYIMRLVHKQSAVPADKFARIKLKEFKREYKKSIKNIKAEIKSVAGLPNPDENILKLERLLRQLETYKKPGFLFRKFYGLDKLKIRKNKKKFVNPIKAEKKKIKQEIKESIKAEKSEKIKAKNAIKALPFTERFKIRLKNNFNEKKNFFTRSGFGAISAFSAALAAVTIVQPFIASDARFNLAMPEQILSALTSAAEYALVGSDSRVYGGYSGGMGGGNLYRPGGVHFKNKPILQLDLQNSPRISSGVIYLKGFVGSIYDGKKWQESDKNYITEYDKIMENPIFSYYKPELFFRIFTESMQDTVGAPYNRRAAELKYDRITIEHLVRGGRLIFTPYFTNTVSSSEYRLRSVADLNTEVTNSLFRHPQYTIEFYSVDNVLDRLSGNAVSGMRDYLQRYNTIFEDLRFWSPEQIEERFPGAFLLNYNQAMDFIGINPDFADKYIIDNNYYKEDGGYNLMNSETFDLSAYNYTFIPKEYESELLRMTRESPYRNSSILPSDYILSEMVYYDFVRGHYLQLPEEFPQEITNLAQELTKDSTTDYDKALALEDYLARNYEYTLNPREPYDTEQDFVYNFLFDVKEGYCSYYATAMTVMLRSLGIPAREVEGYIVDTRKITKDENGNPLAVVVLDSNAHAWTEVYLRGIGWIPFEPTAAYYQEEEIQEAAPYVYTPPVRLPGYMESTTLSAEEELEDDESTDDLADERDYSNLYKLLIAVFSVMFVVSVFHLINYMINRRRFKYFKTAEASDATIKMLNYVLNFLRLCGFVIQSDEGLVEFAKRISHSFPMLHSNGWVNIMRIMQKARYSVHEISEKERTYVYRFLRDLREECLKNLTFRMKFKLRFLRFVI